MELFENAFAGFNIIPTILLILVVIYWLIVIIGLIDFDFIDFDLDMDLESGESANPLHMLAAFLRIGEVPLGLVISIIVLNYWIITMMFYYLPINPDSMIYGVLIIPAFLLSLLLTKYEIYPLKKVFRTNMSPDEHVDKALDKRCVLLNDVKDGRLGQAELKKEGASIIINVKAEFDYDVFKKGEIAFVFRKDKEKNLYYITKTVLNKLFINVDGGE